MPLEKGSRGRSGPWERPWIQCRDPDWDPPEWLPPPPGLSPSEFRDFWAFLQRFRRLRPPRSPPPKFGGAPNPLGLPPHYDPQLRINLALLDGGDPQKGHGGDPQEPPEHRGGDPEDFGDPPEHQRRDPKDFVDPPEHQRRDPEDFGEPPKHQRRDPKDFGEPPKHQRRDPEDFGDPPKHQRRDPEDFGEPPKRHRGNPRDPQDPPKRHPKDSGDPPKRHCGDREDPQDAPKHRRRDPRDPGDPQDPPKHHQGDHRDPQDPPKRHWSDPRDPQDPPKRHRKDAEDLQDPPKHRRRNPEDPQDPPKHHRGDPEDLQDPPKHRRRDPEDPQDPPKRHWGDPRDPQDPPKRHWSDPRDPQNPPKRHRKDSEDLQDPPKHRRRDPEDLQDPPKHHQGDPRDPQDPPKRHRKDAEELQDPPKHHRGDPGDPQDPPKHHRGDPGDPQDPPKHHRKDCEDLQDPPKHQRRDPEDLQDPPKRHRKDSEDPLDPPKRHRGDPGDPQDPPNHHRTDPGASGSPRKPLPGGSHLREVRRALLHYLCLRQRGSFARLARLCRARAALPVARRRRRILALLARHQVLVVAGDTGCGKSTQVPQYLLEAGYRQVCCAQPRRVACAALARRVGLETLGRYQVGFQTRFERTCARGAHLVFVTLGLLLRQLQSDPGLARYQVLVADEVHERHLPGDLLLGALRRLLPRRPALRLLLMSATCDPHLFAAYFGGAPVLQVPGRLYPVKVLYQPIPSEPGRAHLDAGPYLRVLEAIDAQVPREERGDVLVFLSGAAEIQQVLGPAQVYARHTQRWVVLPLHGSLPAEQQDKVFHLPPPGVRKCILATNIAETSVTIDGVRFVVDSGKVKELRYDGQAKVRRLQESWISRASAEQRKGRAGRTGPGTCIRLYSREHLEAFARYPQPEIHRVALDSLVLQVKSMGLGDPRTFPFLEAPPPASLAAALRYLQDQGALDEQENLTPIGHLLAHLPVDVVVGKVLVLGALSHLSEAALTVAAALSVPSPFLRPSPSGHTWAEARRPLQSPHGDPLTLLNLFNQWLQVKAEGRESSRRWCRRRGVAEHRLYEIADLRRQFQELLQEHELLQEGSGRAGRGQKGGRRLLSHAQRAGERHLLSHAQRAGEPRPRVLRLPQEEEGEEEEEEEEEESRERDGLDTQAVRFQLRHDPRQLRLTCGAHLAPPQVALLGLLLARGLYPQLALPDPRNPARRDSEQVFHTRAQQGVALHPTGVFASRPDLLQPQGSPGEPNPHHQLVAFVSLLETTRPYLLTCLRVPALQVLLLCSRSLAAGGRRVVADGWLELTCEDAQVSRRLLGVAVRLRLTWDRLLGRLLRGGGARPRPSEVEELTWGLLDFLEEQVPYELRQLTRLQQQHLYLGSHLGPAPSPDLQSLFPGTHLEPDPVRGGTKVTDFLTWGCLASDPDLFGPCLRRFWTCPRCDLHLPLTAPERLHHQDTCGAPEGTCGAPEGTRAAPEDTGAAPEDTRKAPEGTWSPPEDTRKAPEGTWSPPEDTRKASEGTWSPPEDTCGAPEGTWSPPEDTCGAPEGTGGAPEGTWSPPEDTCGAPEGTWSPPEDTRRAPEGTWSPPEGIWSPPEGTWRVT